MTYPRFDNADDLNDALDRFLRPCPRVHIASMEVFARRTARFLTLPDPPRPAASTLRALGVVIAREGLPAGLCAVWTVESDRYRVRLSPFLSAPRADFTLWHEWFEIMAARPTFPSPVEGRARESLADRFAACLMMPSDAVLRAAKAFPPPSGKTGVLAARFGVSPAAMRRRLRELRDPRELRELREPRQMGEPRQTGEPRDGSGSRHFRPFRATE